MPQVSTVRVLLCPDPSQYEYVISISSPITTKNNDWKSCSLSKISISFTEKSCHKGWKNLIILHSSSNIGLLPLNFCQNFQNWLARSASLQMQGISSIKLRAVSAKITLLSKDDESCVRADLYLQQYWRVTTLLLTVWSGQLDVTNGKCL